MPSEAVVRIFGLEAAGSSSADQIAGAAGAGFCPQGRWRTRARRFAGMRSGTAGARGVESLV